MKLVIHPAVEADRLIAVATAAPGAEWVNAATPDEALAAMPGADGFLGKITPAMLERADRSRWVQTFTASLEHYMFPACRPPLHHDQHAGALRRRDRRPGDGLRPLLRPEPAHVRPPPGRAPLRAGRRRVGPGEQRLGAGDGQRDGPGTIFLPDATMGIVGLGAIGAEIARRALAFGMTVVAVDRFPERTRPPEGVESVEGMDALPDLLAASDFVVIAAPHTPETAGLFDASTISQMKPSGYLINIGRGAIVVLDDLVAALDGAQIAGAALDVFEVEPLPADHPLWDFPNVILTPHTAGYSPAIARRHLETLVENVGRFARGEPLLNVVDKTLWF